MKKGYWILFLGAIAAAVIAGVIGDWLNKQFNSPANQCANRTSWYRQVFSAQSLPNLNSTGANPAAAYPQGAPVTNYRPFLRSGQLELPAQ